MKPLHLLTVILLFTTLSYGQKTDTLRIFYKTDEYMITKQDRQRLDSFLRMNWDRISINGFTDETDSEDYNLELSKKRAASVKQYLVSNYGIDALRITSEGKGAAEPVSDNTSVNGKAKNRRVEFTKL